MQPVITVRSFHHQREPERQQEPVKDGSLAARENDVFTVAVGSVWASHFIPGRDLRAHLRDLLRQALPILQR